MYSNIIRWDKLQKPGGLVYTLDMDSHPKLDQLSSLSLGTALLNINIVVGFSWPLRSDCLLLKISVWQCIFTVLLLDSGQYLFGLHQCRYTYLYSTHTGRIGC